MPLTLQDAGKVMLGLMYHTLSMSTVEMARVLSCTQQGVSHKLKRLGIPIRSKSESNKLRQIYYPTPRGEASPHYKHGLDGGGYRASNHDGKTILEHRAIAEQLLGRSLTKQEVVHHCNGVRNDNRPENLWVFPNQSAHTTYHNTGKIHPDTIFLKDHL